MQYGSRATVKVFLMFALINPYCNVRVIAVLV